MDDDILLTSRRRKRKSHYEAWRKALIARDPTMETEDILPVNIIGHIDSRTKDPRVELAQWILFTNEEYFYEHSMEMLSKHRAHMSLNYLRISRSNIQCWQENLKDFIEIGSGAFGTVYKATDVRTGEPLAIKEIKVDVDDSTAESEKNGINLRSKLLKLLVEKDALIRSNSGAHIVRFYASFQDILHQSFWLVFEFCPCTLSGLFDRIDLKPTIHELLYKNIMRKKYAEFEKTMLFDWKYICLAYIYQISSGLCYLAQRRILHNDLKQDNILISRQGFIKITDLGAVERLRWINRYTQMNLLEVDDFQFQESSHRELSFQGSLAYSDPESLVYYKFAAKIPSNSDIYKGCCSKGSRKNFLSDIYSAGYLFLDLMLLGFQIQLKDVIDSVKDRYKIKPFELSKKCNLTYMIYHRDLNENYLGTILDNLEEHYNKEIIDYIRSIFEPKSTRAAKYTEEISTYDLDKFTKYKVLSQSAIDDFKIFRSMKFVNGGDQSIKFDSAYYTLLESLGNKKNKKIATTFEQLIKKIKGTKTKTHEKQHVALAAMNMLETLHYADAYDRFLD